MAIFDGFLSGARRLFARGTANALPPELRSESALADPYHLFKFSSMTTYNPSALIGQRGYKIINKMRLDEQIKAALQLKKHAVVAPGWRVRSPKNRPDDWAPTVAVRRMISGMRPSIGKALSGVMSALDYGFSVTEQMWTEDYSGALLISSLRTKKPDFFTFDINEYGETLAIKQLIAGREGMKLPMEKFIVYTHGEDFVGNPYGVSDLEAAYRPWWSKDMAFRWMAMYLERFGIPPIFAFYKPDMSPAQVTALQQVLTTIQSGTAGVIPRATKDSVELWTPENQGGGFRVDRTFIPAIDFYDRRIALSILLPGLLGFSPEQASGSMARSRVHFDVFMLVVDAIRLDLQEEVVNDRIVDPMLLLNFGEMDPEDRPRFEFLPVNDSVRTDIMTAWTEQVAAGTVRSGPQDEAHIRQSLEFPEMSDDPATPENEALGEEPDPPTELVQKYKSESIYDKKVNFALIEKDLDRVELSSKARLSVAIKLATAKLAKTIRRDYGNPKLMNEIKALPLRAGIADAISLLLEEAYNSGTERVSLELDNVKKNAVTPPTIRPKKAIDWLKQKQFWVTGVVSEDLLAEARAAIAKGMSAGSSIGDVMGDLEARFAPWIDDPTKITDGIVKTPARLETIIRTNTTDAYNVGRVTQARQAGDFLKGFEYSAILDERTTDVCAALNGRVFKKDDPALDALRPPRHFNCRSIMVPVTIDEPVEESSWVTPALVGSAKQSSGRGFTHKH